MPSIDIEGLPEKYDATQMLQALEAIVGQLESAQAAPGLAQAPEMASWPREPTRLSLGRRNRLGTYATDTDPRISDPQVVSQGEVVGGIERFEIVRGAQLGPWGSLPVTQLIGAPLNELHLQVATLIPRIPHRLGRLPEKIVCIDAPTDVYNREVRVGGGNDPGSRTEYGLDDELRQDMCFTPIFGTTPEDVERSLRMWVGSTPRPPGFNSYNTVAASLLDIPDLPTQFFSDCVTTEDSFAGILTLCVWGWPSFNYFIEGDYGGVHLDNPVTGRKDTQWSMAIPHCGKVASGLECEKWLGGGTSLQDVSDDGLSVYLASGGLQFLLR